MFNKGNCPVPSQLPASHCSGKPFSNMRWMSLEATSRRRRILLAGFFLVHEKDSGFFRIICV